MMANKTIRVATDVGGTFTDLVCFETDHATGQSRIVTAKSDTTPPNFEQGVLNVLEKGGVDPKSVGAIGSARDRGLNHDLLPSAASRERDDVRALTSRNGDRGDD